MKAAAKTHRNKYVLLVVVSILILLLVMVTGINLHNSHSQMASKAQAANVFGLNGLTPSGATELTVQTSKSCIRLHWYGRYLCTAIRTRAYAILTDASSFTSKMQQALQVHGWYSAYDRNLPNGYFFSPHLKNGMIASADVVRLAYADNGSYPLQSEVAMQLVDKTAILNSSSLQRTDSLDQKIRDAIGRGNDILVITSSTSYQTWL
jgi:hypothetical protein